MPQPGLESDSDKAVDRLNDAELWRKVREGYVADTPTRDPDLTKELDAVRVAMQAFAKAPWNRYMVVKFLGAGGTGVVFKVWDTSLRTYRALKISRPIEGKEDIVAGLLSEEISRLQEVSHPNVISIFDAGHLSSPQGDLPFFTMTFLREALPAQKYFASTRTSEELLEFVRGLLSGISHLHSRALLHLDIKPSNVFVGQGGYAVVADLGGARQLAGPPEQSLLVTCTSGYAHPRLLSRTSVTSGGDDNRRRGTVRRDQLEVAFDLFALGRTLVELNGRFEKASAGRLLSYTRKYLALLAARLLDGIVDGIERPLGLSSGSLSSLKYTAAAEAAFDLDKLTGHQNLLLEIPELSPVNEHVIQVTRGEKTQLTKRLANLLNQPLLRRLVGVSQLGLVRLVYPGATHTRFEHSLGTLSNTAQYITALYNDPINPLFRQIVRADDLVATLLAALLHDLGQYPHAHDLDDVETKVFRHETLTAVLLKNEDTRYSTLTAPLAAAIKKEWNLDPARVLAILDADPNKLSTSIRDRLLHTLVSGPLDADKLDYLIRDSNHCQTVFSRGIDRSRLLATLTVVYERKGTREDQFFALGIHEKGRAAAESVAFTRFQMFRAVYWHHAVRSAKAMLQRAAYEWVAIAGAAGNDANKMVLYDFLLERTESDSRSDKKQVDLFASGTRPFTGRIGGVPRPQWSSLGMSDLAALDWLHERTSPTGQMLVSLIATRELYKRVLVVSASKNQELWQKIQDNLATHERAQFYSEELRKLIAKELGAAIEEAQEQDAGYYVTGLGDPTTEIVAAGAALKLAGSILIDVPRRRGGEALRYYQEDLHRGQREEFVESPSLAESEVWKLLTDQLHAIAGNTRVFVHPHIDVLRRTRHGQTGAQLLPATLVEDKLRAVFGLTSSATS